jgi:hypothetical protein
VEIDDRSIRIDCPTDAMAAVLRPIADELDLEQVRFSVAHGPGLRKRT